MQDDHQLAQIDALSLVEDMLQELRDLGVDEGSAEDPEESARFAAVLQKVAKLHSEREEALELLSRAHAAQEEPAAHEVDATVAVIDQLESKLASVEEAAQRVGLLPAETERSDEETRNAS
jgi:uncharacterized small protein (DUF1192 family)